MTLDGHLKAIKNRKQFPLDKELKGVVLLGLFPTKVEEEHTVLTSNLALHGEFDKRSKVQLIATALEGILGIEVKLESPNDFILLELSLKTLPKMIKHIKEYTND